MILDRLLTRLTQIPGARSLWLRFPLGGVDRRVRHDIFSRPHFAFGVYSAADLAKRLGLEAITVIELGVAGGRGLIALEQVAQLVGSHLGIRIHVVGFDSGQGMPPPQDYRDLPHVWNTGFYGMREADLRETLSAETELVIGDVAETAATWNPKSAIGFVSFDLDYYSSTKQAFALFENRKPESRLPRTYCYFDDTFWPEHACHNEYVGELGAIRKFNEKHEHQKICPIHLLRLTRLRAAPWNEQMYVHHDFQHPLYGRNITPQGAGFREFQL